MKPSTVDIYSGIVAQLHSKEAKLPSGTFPRLLSDRCQQQTKQPAVKSFLRQSQK